MVRGVSEGGKLISEILEGINHLLCGIPVIGFGIFVKHQFDVFKTLAVDDHIVLCDGVRQIFIYLGVVDFGISVCIRF